MRLRPGQVAAILAVGIIGVLIPGLQPQLLGALASEGRLSAAALGTLAAVELLAMGMAAGAAQFVLGGIRLRLVAAVLLVATGAIDVLTPRFDTGGLFLARILAGLGEGVLVWIAIGFIVRTVRPERWSGIYLALQTLAQLALASIIGLRGAGVAEGFAILGIVTLAGVAAVAWIPDGYQPLASDASSGGAPAIRGALALIGVVLYLSFVVATWVYVEPLAGQRGLGPGAIRLIAPLSLAMQVLGAGTAAVLANRLSARASIVVVALVNLGVLALMAMVSSAASFVAATALFGFLWLFVMPFQVLAVIAADPTRRAATLIGGAQLVGSSLGPLLAGRLVDDANLTPVLGFGAACLLGGVAALIAAASRSKDAGA